jgi:hypothetical protein
MSNAKTLKVSVLANGNLLLDGRPVTLPDLEAALKNGAREGAAVWYYREDAAGQAPPIATEVMKRITSLRLPIRFSTRPDFSDSVTSTWEQLFAMVREKAAQGQLMILRPDGRVAGLPALNKAAIPDTTLAAVERILPSAAKRNVAAIADTQWSLTGTGALQAAHQAIPFFGILIGFATLGHAVWLFQPANLAALSSGCRAADVLIVDSARLPGLPAHWQAAASRSMRGSQILVHDRATYQLRKC